MYIKIVNRNAVDLNQHRKLVVGTKVLKGMQLEEILNAFRSLYESSTIEVTLESDRFTMENSKYKVVVENYHVEMTKFLNFILKKKEKFENIIFWILEILEKVEQIVVINKKTNQSIEITNDTRESYCLRLRK
jgi:phosphopantetheine adenylyltransferase